jgi:hypothetical protein
MNSIELEESIVDVIQAGLVAMVTSSPGLGKSSIAHKIAKTFNLMLIDLRLSQCDPTDMLGFPTHDGARMGYAPPKHFPLEGIDSLPKGKDGWLLLLDEFTSAALSTQAAAYKLVLDRMVGEYKLHKNVAIVCAGNKDTDSAIVNRMSTAMQSRLIHLELDVDVKAWLSWASENGIDYRVVSYIESRPEHLHQFDPNHNDKTFATPRTWEFASKLIKGKETSPRMLNLLIGTISAGIAHEFNAHIMYCSELPTIAQITANPNTIVINSDPSLLYATSHMVAAYLEEKNADKLMEYIKRLPLEFGTTAIRSALKRNKELLKLPPVRSWSHEIAAEIF